jgi:hypothetical protein
VISQFLDRNQQHQKQLWMSKAEESAYSWTMEILDMMVVREQEATKMGLVAYDIACRILLCLEDPL